MSTVNNAQTGFPSPNLNAGDWRFTPLSLMAVSKLFIFSMFFPLLFIRIATQKSHLEEHDAISSLRIELERLKSKVSLLESRIEKSNNALRSKDDEITQMENIILEKSESIASLQNEIETLQQKESEDAIVEVNRPHSHTAELEKQVGRLKAEIETQDQKVGLEVQANTAQKKIQEINLKSDNLQKVSYEQKTRILETEQALQEAEEEMIKAEPKATFTGLVKDYQRWLPYWLVVNLNHFQSFIVARWKNCWRPALDASFPKILVKLSQVQRDCKMCIETFKTEWIPVMKDQWLTFISDLYPHLESLSAKSIEAYHATMNSLLSHAVEVQKVVVPFIQEAYKFARPYINQIGTKTKSYIDMAVVTSAISYHKQIQQMLKTSELTRPLASMELAWFVATALLCLPFVFLCKLYSAIFRKKARKYRRISHANHNSRRLKKTSY